MSATIITPTPDYDAAIAFLSRVHPNRPWALSAINSETGDIDNRMFDASRAADCRKWLAERGDTNWNLYWTTGEVAARFANENIRASKKHIERCHLLHTDIDPERPDDMDAQRAAIRRFLDNPPGLMLPSAIISSGRGLQALWLLKTPQVIGCDETIADEVARYNEHILQLAKAQGLKADSVQAVSWLLRLPGCINWGSAKKRAKGFNGPPVLVSVEWLGHDRAYTIEQFTKAAAGSATPKGKSKVEVAAGWSNAAPVNIDDFGRKLRKSLKDIIRLGIDPADPTRHPSRSEWLYAAVCGLVRAKLSDRVIFSIITDARYKISDSVLDKGGRNASEKYAQQQIASAREDVASETHDADEELPEGAIVVQGGQINELVATAEQLLLDSKEDVYQRGKSLVRPVVLDQATAEELERTDSVQRVPGSLVIMDVTKFWLVRALASKAAWFQKYGEKTFPTDPPMWLAEHVLDNVGGWKFPVLRGVTATPLLRPDGTLCQTPGYDPLSGYIYNPLGVSFPPVRETPTRDDALAALALFEPIFAGFPFKNDAAKATFYASILTGLNRPNMATAPAFVFDAPRRGTGKGKLAECAGTIVLGCRPAHVTMAQRDEEFEKRLHSIVLQGDPVVWVDEITREFGCETLNAMLTNPEVSIRILGASKTVKCPFKALVLASGNNVTFRGDMERRVLICYLDANTEKPEDRAFDFEPVTRTIAERPQLVSAGLTILRAYIAAGSPGIDKLVPFGSFGDFDLIRGALVWLGFPDPCLTREDVVVSDEASDVMPELLRVWYETFAEKLPTTAALERRQTISWIHQQHNNCPTGWENLIRLLKEATGIEAAMPFNPRQVGRRLLRYMNVVAGGYKLVQVGKRDNGLLWRVDRLSNGQPPTEGRQLELQAAAPAKEIPF